MAIQATAGSATLWAARQGAAATVKRLRELVSYESPSNSLSHLQACASLLDGWGTAVLGRPARRVTRRGLPHLLWAVPDQRVLLLGHYDTVWPADTIRDWPFQINGEQATGPGVCDMKAGIVTMFAALGLVSDTSRVGVLLTGDEETGSQTSRRLIEQQAKRSGAVLVLEPATADGSLKIARKGGSVYRLTARGRAAHAGVEPHRGVNAGVELAMQILAVQELADQALATTVTPTMLSGGTTTNTVPEAASVSVDVRAWTREELHRVDRAMRALRPRLAEAELHVEGGVNRYPLTPDVAQPLLDTAQLVAKELGLPVPDGAHAAGASDGNFTGALGVPTLDGLGAVGGNSHARGEYVDVARLSERTALLAGLIERLVVTAPQP
jgi:glutamate carboxypeptidase